MQLKWHPDDLKKFNAQRINSVPSHSSEYSILQQFFRKLTDITNEMEDSYESLNTNTNNNPTPTEETSPISSNNNDARVTRSQGQSLTWNPQMNAGDVLLPSAEHSEQVNGLHIQEYQV